MSQRFGLKSGSRAGSGGRTRLSLAEVVRQLASHLSELELSFALVGGIATSARAEPRFTRDVDVAVAVESDEDAEHLLFRLASFGYVTTATVEQAAVGRLATARLVHPSGIVCDLIFATSGIEHEIVRDADVLDVFDGVEIPTASPEALLAMKVLSCSERRPRDLEDIRALLHGSESFAEDRVVNLLRLIGARGFARGEDLLRKWDELKQRFS